MPKGVVLTHYNIVANILQVAHVERLHLRWQVDVQLGIVPFFHIYVSKRAPIRPLPPVPLPH